MKSFLFRILDNQYFFASLFVAFLGLLGTFLIAFSIDAEMCRIERENLRPQNCIFTANIK